MPQPTDRRSDAIPVAIVYWGRLGAGAALMNQIAEALAHDDRFVLYASPSLQSELPVRLPAARILPIQTFSGPLSLACRTARLPLTVDRLIRQLAAAKVRAIVTIMPHVWGLALQRAAHRAGIATILIVHDADPHPGERRPILDRLARLETRRSDRIVTLSNHVADRLITRKDVVDSRLNRLWHPILRFGSDGDATALPRSPFRLLFFGRILPYKGIPLLLEAFAALRARGVDCSLRIVGRGRIEAPPHLLRQPGLTIEEGWVPPDAIGNILVWGDALALPYLEASQSGVIAAAYGAGLPVVATPVGGLIEQIVDGETGTLAATATAAALADAIARLIETPGLYAACRSGVARYAAERSSERFARALGDIVMTAAAET